jgi:hypothetical protein
MLNFALQRCIGESNGTIERIDGEKGLSEATVDGFKRNAFGCESNRKKGRSRIKTVAGSFY